MTARGQGCAAGLREGDAGDLGQRPDEGRTTVAPPRPSILLPTQDGDCLWPVPLLSGRPPPVHSPPPPVASDLSLQSRHHVSSGFTFSRLPHTTLGSCSP